MTDQNNPNLERHAHLCGLLTEKVEQLKKIQLGMRDLKHSKLALQDQCRNKTISKLEYQSATKELKAKANILKGEYDSLASEKDRIHANINLIKEKYNAWEKEVRAPLKAKLQAEAEQHLAELAEIRQERAELKETMDGCREKIATDQLKLARYQAKITQHHDNIDTIVRDAFGVNKPASKGWMKSKQSDTVPPKYRGQISSQTKTKDAKQTSTEASTRLFSAKSTKHSLGAKPIDGDNSSGYGSGASSGGDSPSSSPKSTHSIPAHSN